MEKPPRFSLVLVVRNGMPHLPEALESVKRQTFSDFELVIQDGASTDGTVDVLKGLTGIPRVLFTSCPDNSLAHGYNLALPRCTGEIVGTIDADNLLEPDALEKMDREMRARPECGVIYASQKLIRADGTLIRTFVPRAFDLLSALECFLVPPFGSAYFNRRVCGAELRMDERLPNCPDYDLWLRMSRFEIVRSETVVSSTRINDNSISCRAESYEKFLTYKSATALEFIRTLPRERLDELLRARVLSGMYAWAAQSTYNIEGASPQFARYLEEAQRLYPNTRMVEEVLTTVRCDKVAKKKLSLTKRLKKAWKMLRKGQF
ncbi:MAG: glycosyltransferase [Planctomycetota bacterium]|nr:glycosyltransferase [Planctomycetota bacterium]